MTGIFGKNHWPTVAAVGLLAMCVVSFDHEALGHGSVCLLLHGRILLLTSSVFRCEAKSDWIDPAGPASNVLMGAIALACARFVPRERAKLRLFLMLVAAFSFFWESAYLARAMLKREGDLYLFSRSLMGDLSLWERLAGAAVGLAFYVVTVRIVSTELARMWPEASVARAAARTAWVWATIGTAVAALANANHDWGDVRDAVLEIGGASLPLLLIPIRDGKVREDRSRAVIPASPIFIGLAGAAYLLFVATLGRGVSV